MESLVKEGALGSVLVQSQIITEEDIKAALQEQDRSGCRFGEALVKLGIVTQEDIDWALSSQLNIPYVRLKPEMIDADAIRLIPASLARKYNLIPLYRAGDEISIALADPLNRGAVEAVEQVSGCRVAVSIPIIRELREMIDIFYGSAEEVKTLGFSSAFFPAKILDSINKDTGGARFLDYMLIYIVRNRLNSISLQPLGDVVSVIGKQGRLTREIGRLAIDYYPDLMMHVRKQARMKGYTDISARGNLEHVINGEKVYFRVLALKGHDGDYVTLKTHVPVSFPCSLEGLGMTGEKESAFRELAASGQGVVLVGTVAPDDCHRLIDLFLEECDTAGKTVMILGDGVGKGSKQFPHVSFQKSRESDTASVMAAVLEHDPDIVVLEDAADDQILRHAALAAMGGKLVVCGIAGRDPSELPAFLGSVQSRDVLLPSLRGVISLTAGMESCPHCSTNTLSGQENSSARSASSPGDICAAGCSACGYTGFRGRKYLTEVIPFAEDLQQIFGDGGYAEGFMNYLENRLTEREHGQN